MRSPHGRFVKSTDVEGEKRKEEIWVMRKSFLYLSWLGGFQPCGFFWW